jgi:hypothetical protein
MPNMSYVRFENTLTDLRDCHQNMDDEISDSEDNARQRLIKLCKSIADEYSYLLVEQVPNAKLTRADCYPTWICTSCGEEYGNKCCGVATWHVGVCDICGIETSVTEPRDFGHLKTKNGVKSKSA